MMVAEQLYTTREAAKELETTEQRLGDLIRREKLPEPTRVGHRRVWTRTQIEHARPIVKRNA